MRTRPIRFFRRGQVHTVTDAPVARTVLQYLREDVRCTGIREGCAEDDYGACTVMLDELQEDGGVELKAVNACIQFLSTLDDKALFTVEGVRGKNSTLHPVQEMMVECHGSQCGFCAPGFIMSFYALYENTDNQAPVPSRQTICDSLTDSLYRCIGYHPIINAGERMFELPSPAGIDRTRLVDMLRKLQRKGAFSYMPVGTENVLRLYAPRTTPALASIKTAHPNIRILAGSTDVSLWVTKQLRNPGNTLYIGQVADLYALEGRDGWIEIGTVVSLEKAYAFLAMDCPEMTELWKRFASLPVHNAGTLGGNIANGLPIDGPAPAFIAIDTRVVLQCDEVRRKLPLGDLYLAYQKNAMEEDEFVAGLRIPTRKDHGALRFRTYKPSKRFSEDISAVCVALTIEPDGNVVHSTRVTYDGMAAASKHATETENTIPGQPWNKATVRATMTATSRDYTSLTDMRATGNYRCISAANTIYRFWLETRTDAPLVSEQINVRTVELNTPTAV